MADQRIENGRFGMINSRSINQIAGLSPHQELSAAEIFDLARELSPVVLNRERAGIQALEATFISADARNIQQHIRRMGFSEPSLYSIFTVGFPAPEKSTHIGTYGEGSFEGFPSPAIKGHPGKAVIVPIGENGETMLAFIGRAHPNEWTTERYGNMIVAHPLRVVKEMIRRQRTLGKNPPVVLSYVTGVTERYKMKPGDLGVIIDDSTLDNISHPGWGPVDVLDPLIGEHFQPKAGRSSHVELGKLFQETAKRKGIKTFPVAVCGTPGLTEYQSFGEVPIFKHALEQARKDKGLASIARQIYGFWGPSLLAPLWDMGITFEEATMRQIRKNERPFTVLAITLPTDSVGGEQSLTVNHDLVAANALATGPRNSQLMLDFAREVLQSPVCVQEDRTDFSLDKEFSKYLPIGED